MSRYPTAVAVMSLGLALVLGGCSGSDEPSDSAQDPASSTSGAVSETPTDTTSASPTATPTPVAPARPAFADTPAGRKAFVRFVVASWGYALRNNEPRALTSLSGKKPCRGCDELTAELTTRRKQGWFVDFPGADLRTIKIERGDDVLLATAVGDIPGSRSYFDDGTFRNDNDEHRRAKFLIDLGLAGEKKKRRYVLLAFSIK